MKNRSGIKPYKSNTRKAVIKVLLRFWQNS